VRAASDDANLGILLEARWRNGEAEGADVFTAVLGKQLVQSFSKGGYGCGCM
jgi:hypothetical protein